MIKILWAVLGLILLIIILMHMVSYYMHYDEDDIIDVLPGAIVNIDFFDSIPIRSVYMNNHSDTLIVFIHGAPGNSSAFLGYLSDSSFQSYNLLTYDRPGYGNSSPYPMSSIVDQTNVLLNIINRHESDCVILIGHSYGGTVAGFAAAAHREIIDKAIMISPLLDPEKEPIFWYSHFSKWPLTKWLLTNDFKTAGVEKFMHAKSLVEIEPYWKLLQSPILHIHGGKDVLAPPSL